MNHGSKLYRMVYHAMPLPLKNGAASLYGAFQRKSRYGDIFREHLEFLKTAQYWEITKLMSYSKMNADAFIEYAAKNSEYYSGDIYKNFAAGDDIARLPLVSKDALRNSSNKVSVRMLKGIKHRWSHSSGTTGTALVFPLSEECFQKEYAFRALHYDWGGVGLNNRDRIAFCSGHPVAHHSRVQPPFWVYDWVNNWLYFSSYHMSEKNLESYVKELDHFMPMMLGGYPSSIYLIAKAYRKHGKGKLPLKAIYCSSETLLDFQRREIEDVFQVKVFNWYGTSEMCVNIVECQSGEMHVKHEHSYIEVLKKNGQPAAPGEKGRVVCTAFANSAFPLIRYDLGDEVKISLNQQSRCGRGGLLVDEVIGRVEDYIVTGDGRMVGRLDHVFKDTLAVREAQLLQEKQGEVLVRIVKTDAFSMRDEERIKDELVFRLGTATQIALEYVPTIPRTDNGKFRFVESKIKLTN